MSEYSDNIPMIQKPYKFNHHDGYQGVAHCGILNDSGTYYMVNQGRLSSSIYNMVLHVRKIWWIDDWPVVSPERYANVPQCDLSAEELTGEWEYMPLIYNKSVLHSTSQTIVFSDNGTINDNSDDTWQLQDSLLTINWNNGETTDKLLVSWGWDWENYCVTPVFTGMDETGICKWGKKVNQEAIDRFTKIEDGGIYTIRNHFSNMYMEVPGNSDAAGISIKQNLESGEDGQLWQIHDDGDGNYKIQSYVGEPGKYLYVQDDNNGTDLVTWNQFDGNEERFQINYNNDGWFHIMTGISNYSKCLDVEGFSIDIGGNIFQWEYLDGLNQAWRFKRVDLTNGTALHETLAEEHSSIQIIPNPSYDGKIQIQLMDLNEKDIINISVYDYLGKQIIDLTDKLQTNRINLYDLIPGIYFVIVKTHKDQHVKKLVIRY